MRALRGGRSGSLVSSRIERERGPGCSALVAWLCVGVAFGIAGPSARATPFQPGPPLPAPPVTAPVGGWSAWQPAPSAKPAALSPALAFDPISGALDFATVGLDLQVRSYRLVADGWIGPVPADGVSFRPPALLAGPAGALHMIVTGPDGMVTERLLQSGAWGLPRSTGTTSFLPPAAVRSSAGDTLEMITVGVDAGVRHSRLRDGAWSRPAPLNVLTFREPALATNPAGGLELALIGLDRQIYHSHFNGSRWSEFRPTGVQTETAAALAVGADGTVHLAATGLDRRVMHSRFFQATWSAPVWTGVESELSPALVAGDEGRTLELLARGLDRTVMHGRFLDGHWAIPVSLGITTDARPALASTTGPALAAAVMGTDGQLYVSHFTVSPPPAPVVSFSRDVIRILTDNGEKSCTNCHAGSFPTGGLNLETDQAYRNLVNVDSNQVADRNRIVPGIARDSYLYQKITGAPGISGSRMPLAGGPLAEIDINLIRRWIDAGALDN